MKKVIASFLLAFITLSSFAGSLDVKPISKLKVNDPYVRITRLSNQKIKFERCVSGYEKTGCDQLGNKKSYSLEELRDQRLQEKLEVGYSVLGDVLAVVAFKATAIYASGALAYGLVGGTLTTITGHAMVGTGALIVGTAFLDLNVLNPFEQSRQAKTLDEEVINDKDVRIDSDTMEDFIDRLDLVLSKI